MVLNFYYIIIVDWVFIDILSSYIKKGRFYLNVIVGIDVGIFCVFFSSVLDIVLINIYCFWIGRSWFFVWIIIVVLNCSINVVSVVLMILFNGDVVMGIMFFGLLFVIN